MRSLTPSGCADASRHHLAGRCRLKTSRGFSRGNVRLWSLACPVHCVWHADSHLGLESYRCSNSERAVRRSSHRLGPPGHLGRRGDELPRNQPQQGEARQKSARLDVVFMPRALARTGCPSVWRRLFDLRRVRYRWPRRCRHPRRHLGSGPATYVIAASAACGALVGCRAPSSSPSNDGKPTTPPLTRGVRAILADRVLCTVTVASSLGQLGPGALAVVAAVLATAQGRPLAGC